MTEKTGYPSKDRNHDDFYETYEKEFTIPQTTLFDYLYERNKKQLYRKR